MPKYILGPKGWSEKLELEVCNDKTKQIGFHKPYHCSALKGSQ